MNSQLILTACGVFAAILALALSFYIKHKEIFDKRIKIIFIILLFIDLIVFAYALTFSPDDVNSPPMIVSLMPDKMNSQEAGTTIKWTATALDPEKDPVQYKFFLDGQEMTSWSHDSTWYWNTSTVDIGSHTIEVKVKDGKHNADGDDSKYIDFTISSGYIRTNEYEEDSLKPTCVPGSKQAICSSPDSCVDCSGICWPQGIYFGGKDICSQGKWTFAPRENGQTQNNSTHRSILNI